MGKKRKYTVMVGVMFKPETLKQLEKVTDEQEISKSEFIREIVEAKLNQENFKATEK
jgi:metal-responsive CopG/Arc/MetJ family transcriptional regulator